MTATCGDRGQADPPLRAVEHPVRSRPARRRSPCSAGSLPAVGSVRPKQPISSPVGHPGQPLLLLLLGAELVDRAHRQRTLHADEGAQAGVARLQLHGGQPVLDGAAAGAAVARQVHAEQAEFADLGGDLAREDRRLVPRGDVRADPLVDERADLVAERQFLGGEEGVQVQVVRARSPIGVGARDGSGVDSDGRSVASLSWCMSPGCRSQAASSRTAMPWPTPMHMVARARRAPRSCSSMRGGQGEPGAAGAQRVAQRDRAAVRVDVLGVVGQAQLTAAPPGPARRTPRSARPRRGRRRSSPARASSFRVAGTGPMPITSGAAPRRPRADVTRASGSRP